MGYICGMKITAYIAKSKGARKKGLRTITPSGVIRSGAECYFVPFSNGRALKLFFEKREARLSRMRQNKAWKAGIGPRVYSDLRAYRMRDYHGNFTDCNWWGYWTEIAQPCNSSDLDKEMPLLQAYRKVFGRPYLDISSRNMGYIKGKLVVVDFGSMST